MIYLLSVIVVVLSVLLILSMRKVNQYEKYMIDWEEKKEIMSKIILDSELKLKEIDYKGSFEADDEVGYFFIMLKEIQNLLNDAEKDLL